MRSKIAAMLADNQRLAVRVDHPLRALVFTLYEYHREPIGEMLVYEKPHAIPFEHLSLPAFDPGRLLEFLQSKMPSAFPTHEAFKTANAQDAAWI